MEKSDLLNLISEMFMTIKLLSGYPVPEKLPEVFIVPIEQIQQMICKGPCQVKAFYLPDKGVFINDQIDIGQDAFSRSILLHELVHHVQQISGKFETGLNKCDRWYSKELEAYRIQNAYLKQNKEERRFLIDSLPMNCAE